MQQSISLHRAAKSLKASALLSILVVNACSKKPVDPQEAAFNGQWKALAAQEVFYVENEGGQALMGKVPRVEHLPEKTGFAGDDSATDGASQHPVRPPVPVQGVASSGGGAFPEALSSAEVSSVVRRNLGGVRVCYLKLTRSGSGTSGRAIVSFTVEPAGKVGQVRVDSPAFRDTSLPDCVSQQVKRWSFPQTQKGGANVQYPLVFVGG
jgi:TonB family protein